MIQRVNVVRPTLVLTVMVLVSLTSGDFLFAQAGLREALERLDTDGDGEVEPEEITPLARPFLEQITRSSRMSIDRDNDIEDLQEAARRYHAQKNGVSGRDVRPAGERSVKPFGTDDGEPLVPEFGLGEMKFLYTQDDLDFAARTMSSHDRNGDGYIDREEATHERWTHRNPFDDDLNNDDRLSRLELTQRYARRRLLDQASDELRKKAWRTGGEIRSASKRRERTDDSQWWRSGGNSHWLTASVLGRFDANKNGRLESQESQLLGLPAAEIDADRDGDISRDELHAHLEKLQEETGGLSEGIPGWFYELDTDRDSQVSMSEFTTEWTDETIEQFSSLDLNGDGLLTATEVVRSKAMVGGSYANRTAEVLPPGRTIISEIEVSEDYIIGDLNLQLSLTHTNVSHLDAHLTGPDGQRIELFTEVGGRDDHFDETVFDDQSRYPITKARPPFKGTFIPEGLLKRQPSLSYFNGKNAKGVWQLVIRGTRSDRFGMLHKWSLLVKPQESMVGQTAVAPASDGPQANPVVSSWPAARESTSPPKVDSGDGKFESREPSPQRPKIDYQAIGRRMSDAVKAGKMTEEQVRQAWARIKSGGKKDAGGKKDPARGKDAEAIERYRREMELRKRRRD